MISAQALFKALGEPTKHAILCELRDGERCACEIPGAIGKAQPNTSMHLAKLRALGIVQAHRDGKKILYAIKDKRVTRMLALARKG